MTGRRRDPKDDQSPDGGATARSAQPADAPSPPPPEVSQRRRQVAVVGHLWFVDEHGRGSAGPRCTLQVIARREGGFEVWAWNVTDRAVVISAEDAVKVGRLLSQDAA